jgi:hypothetical protein
MANKGASVGRATPKRPAAGRYTAPIPRAKKVSPRWYPWVLVGLLLAGLAVIVINYASIWWGATNWALVGGIGSILVATIMATRYR